MPPPDDVDACQLDRVLDANFNRATEALRVVEEIARFSFGDAHLTRQLKQLRHQLSQLLEPLQARLVRARDTSSDVGRSISTPTEMSRRDLAAVATANFDRLGQSLRTLEEFAKLTDVQLAGALEQLRYRTYILEKALLCIRHGAETWRDRCLYAIVDGGANDPTFARTITQLIDAGVDVIQLRDRALSDRQLLERAKLLVALACPANVLTIINDRIDIALAAWADGVHLGQDDLALPDVRGLLKDRMLVGLSTHSLEQAREAELRGADYIGVGPTFASATKQFTHFPGLPLLEQVAQDISVPCFAIGGIDAGNITAVAATGIRRVAVCGALQAGHRVAEIASSIKSALRSQTHPAPTVVR